MPRRRKKREIRPNIPIAPMIDVVFLMLIYFMVTSSLERAEADISFQLPGLVEQTDPVEMPDEQIIEITAEGQVIVNEFAYDRPDAPRFTELAAMLNRFREASEANRVDAIVTIAPADGTPHRQVIKVMDALSFADIDQINFALGEEGF